MLFNRRKQFAVVGLVVGQNELIVFFGLSGLSGNRQLDQRWKRIDREISVVWLFFFEIIFWFYFRVALIKDIR